LFWHLDFEGILDPDNFDAKEIENHLGWFRISTLSKSFEICLVPQPGSFAKCAVDYEGRFLFQNGRWVAQIRNTTYKMRGFDYKAEKK